MRWAPSTRLLSIVSLMALICVVVGTVSLALSPSYASMPAGLFLGAALTYMVQQRSELKDQAEAEAAIRGAPKVGTPLGILALCQSAGEGNINALAILWQQLYGEPLDPERPFDEVLAEVQVALQAQYGMDADT